MQNSDGEWTSLSLGIIAENVLLLLQWGLLNLLFSGTGTVSKLTLTKLNIKQKSFCNVSKRDIFIT